MKPKQGKKNRAETLAEAANPAKRGKKAVHSDVQGSYTGVPEDGGHPVQDADDL